MVFFTFTDVSFTTQQTCCNQVCSCKRGYRTHMDMFFTPFATEEGPFGAETFC